MQWGMAKCYKHKGFLPSIPVNLSVCGVLIVFLAHGAGLKVNRHAPFHICGGGDAMILICDTRQQDGKHKNIEAYCNRMGIEMIREKCDVGDYMFPDGKIAVDTKQDL